MSSQDTEEVAQGRLFLSRLNLLCGKICSPVEGGLVTGLCEYTGEDLQSVPLGPLGGYVAGHSMRSGLDGGKVGDLRRATCDSQVWFALDQLCGLGWSPPPENPEQSS